MGTVLRNRAAADVKHHKLMYFTRDAGGRPAMQDLPVTDVRIVKKERLEASVLHAIKSLDVAEVSVTSVPSLARAVSRAGWGDLLTYEIHTSSPDVIRGELEALEDLGEVRVRVPSEFTKSQVLGLAPRGLSCRFEVVPNLTDGQVFNFSGEIAQIAVDTPLVWVGRLDRGKNPNDFLRLLSILPPRFGGVLVVSMENDPERLANVLGAAAMYGVLDRVSLRSDIDQWELAALFRGARERGGALVSTSLAESFGYALVEAALCGLPAVGYDVGALAEHGSPLIRLVPVGSVRAIADVLTAEPAH